MLLSPERERQLGYRRRGKGRPGAVKRRSIAQQLDRSRQNRHLQRNSPPVGCPTADTWLQVTQLALRGCLRSILDLSCSSHITWERDWVRFSHRAVGCRENLSEVGFFVWDFDDTSGSPPNPTKTKSQIQRDIGLGQIWRITRASRFGCYIRKLVELVSFGCYIRKSVELVGLAAISGN